MTKTKPTKAQPKPLTIFEAADYSTEIQKCLTFSELHFTVINKPERKEILIISVIHCDSVKVICPAFTLEMDEHCKRYAQLIISYE